MRGSLDFLEEVWLPTSTSDSIHRFGDSFWSHCNSGLLCFLLRLSPMLTLPIYFPAEQATKQSGHTFYAAPPGRFA